MIRNKNNTNSQKLHPCLTKLFNSFEPIITIFEESDDKDNPLIISITKLIKITRDSLGKETPMEIIEPFLDSTLEHELDLKIFLFLMGIQANTLKGNFTQSKILLNLCHKLISSFPNKNIKALYHITLGHLKGCEGFGSQRIKEYKKALSLLKENEKYFTRLGILLIMIYYIEGKKKEIDIEFPQTVKRVKKALKARYYFYSYCNSIETGNLFEAENIIKTVRDSPLIYSEMNHTQLKEQNENLQLQRKTWTPNRINLTKLRPYDVIHLSTYYLNAREPINAINIIRSNFNVFMVARARSSFNSFALIRAELSNSNASAAEQLMDEKKANEHIHYFDTFFLCRIAFLKENLSEASALFKLAIKAAEENDAINKLNYEIDIALEWTPSVILTLMKKQNKKLPSKRILANKKDLTGIDRIIGQGFISKKLKNTVKKYAQIDISILIRGETGVGKEIVARALHEESSRKEEPFLAINCGAIMDSLLQSELFGHEAGAFTGANRAHKGIFETAGAGTVFLDEIGEISQTLQVNLLRVFDEGEFRTVGGTNIKKILCKIITATNAPLEEMVKNKAFRNDLYYRLKRLEINIPNLHERKEDIITLANYFLENVNKSAFDTKLTNALLCYRWPGNIRELRNEMESLKLLNSHKSIYSISDCSFLHASKSDKNKDIYVLHETEMAPIQYDPIEAKNIISNGNGALRRREKIRDLFQSYQTLTRSEIIKILNLSPRTTTEDLKVLVDEKYITRVKPSSSSRSHYFILNDK